MVLKVSTQLSRDRNSFIQFSLQHYLSNSQILWLISFSTRWNQTGVPMSRRSSSRSQSRWDNKVHLTYFAIHINQSTSNIFRNPHNLQSPSNNFCNPHNSGWRSWLDLWPEEAQRHVPEELGEQDEADRRSEDPQNCKVRFLKVWPTLLVLHTSLGLKYSSSNY